MPVIVDNTSKTARICAEPLKESVLTARKKFDDLDRKLAKCESEENNQDDEHRGKYGVVETNCESKGGVQVRMLSCIYI